MPEENVEIVRRGYELYAAGDLEGVAALFSADAELADAGGLGVAGTAAGTRQGPEGFLRANEEVLEAFEDYRVEPGEFIDVGEAVVVPVRISGRGRASGAKQEARLAHLWVLRNGEVIRGEVYRTPEEALEAAGGELRLGP
jgi:ketosteroid isomerase-like protein